MSADDDKKTFTVTLNLAEERLLQTILTYYVADDTMTTKEIKAIEKLSDKLMKAATK